MRRNIDLLAIGLLLAGIGFVSQVRQSEVFELQQARLIDFTHRQVQPFLAKPHLPKLCFMRG
ncbi:MAG: hypothetical protein JO210_19865 [Acidobacteriaceae bacterium]|nr:hypothetical protein [Acidobacteriaceae bacterium]